MNDTGAGNPIESFSSDKNRWGGVLGVGAEWAWSDNWTIKTELLYLKFQEETTTVFSPAGAQNVNFDHNDQVFVARVGVNYRFGGSGPGY
jgi:outer membrane immunogenic protein